ncbi:MAG: ROK family protein [Deltaproteobacteria bacterium]|nr:ROK family protein [Deltaproteobacteria bacterium]
MRIGIDLGGTKIEAIALGEDGRVLARRRVPTPTGDYERTLRAIVELVDGIEGELKARGSVGIGIPGMISPATGLVKNANSTVLIGHALDKDLRQALRREIRIANDANCFAISEAADGAGAGAEVVFGVIVGTGTGGGIVVRGEVLTGPNAIAGEWGHNPLPWPRAEELPGPECYCGKHGCIETFLSGPGLARDYQNTSGKSREPPEIAKLASRGEETAEACLERYEDRMARGLAHVINILDPDVIVLGGGISNIERLYTNVPKLWGRYAFSDRVGTPLLPPRHGESSGVRGAAWLWPLGQQRRGGTLSKLQDG